VNPALFDRSRLRLKPIAERRHGLELSAIKPLRAVEVRDRELVRVAERIQQARTSGREVIFMMGAHVLRAGVQRYLIDLMERGLLSCLCTNGAAVVHDYELSLIGATTESVACYIQDGRFGFWEELGVINEVVRKAAEHGQGLGAAVGRFIDETKLPHRNVSIFANAYRFQIPITVHVGIGYDILHQLPNCDGGAYGATSYQDFLILAHRLKNLTDGVVMNFGSAVMAPEVFLKGLSMARNVAARRGEQINGFTTLVCDLQPLPSTFRREAPRHDPRYFFRPWKTMLVRTVADGESFYVQGDHGITVPQLWTALTQ